MKTPTILILLLFPILIMGQAGECEMFKETVGDSVFYGIKSTSYAPIEVEVIPKAIVLPKSRYQKLSLLPKMDSLIGIIRVHKSVIDTLEEGSTMGKFFSLKAYYGDTQTSKHNDDYIYALPYEKGKKYTITQGFNGKKSHHSIASKYALDFNMKIGDLVCAAREGVVIYTITKFKESGGIDFINKANKILVLHDDGTFGNYTHLNYNGALVKKGDWVTRGQVIGYSGNTGYSGGPHLHFVVREARDISVPIFFEGYEGKILKRRKKYKRVK
ncbi:M23 family metallopeptidase [Spongiimicrobium salis]|uniref:M23 family metallopeptidase n=1 Tax=Spongiimicrobium salis TaxID=1667022 RepID=UPI00374DB47D